ncbi:signal transducer and transcription activator-like [Anopheles marshallii]|uniref:signal transducer and transcription activator-like n=1 Tax=Anopheles marshallii TaxID=1521116 RepID=UPI00237AC9C8|nr:signal transducer and transcription activator-like [Anopheles marshallii]
MACYPWSRLNQLQQPTLEAFHFMYDANISVEVRDQLANWSISQMVNTPTNLDNPKAICDQNAATFLNQLVKKVMRMGAKYSPDIRNDLNKSAHILLELFSSNPVYLFQQLKKCLEPEFIPYPYQFILLADMEVRAVFEELHRLQVMVHENDVELSYIKTKHDYLAQERNGMQEYRAQLNMMLDENIQVQMTYLAALRQDKFNDDLQIFYGKRTALVKAFRHIILMTSQLQDKILNKYLSQWKINQRLVGIGTSANIENNLDTIQLWCESLAEIIWTMKVQLTQTNNTQLEGYNNLMETPNLMTAMKDVKSLCETLIFNSFIIEKQPPQLMKINGVFTATARLLLGKTLTIKANLPQVTVSVISELQAREIYETKKAADYSIGEVTNNVSFLEYNEATRQLSARFTKMRLQKITRMNKQRNKCVMDEKFALLFQLSLTAQHCDLVLPVWAMSCPVIVTVHACQAQQAWANIIWDNAFATIDRTPFNVPEVVCWNWLANALCVKLNGTSSHSMTVDQIHFLCEKAFGLKQRFPAPDDLAIMWSQFCKQNLPSSNYTFWEWFYQVMKLIHEHLQEFWLNGRIIGFIRREQAEQYLTKCQPGTFLLRFSETVVGGISIVFVHESNDGQRKILHVQPFTAKELSILSLADRILDLDELYYLYPDIPKHLAFQRHEMKSKPNHDTNYVAWKLQATLVLPSDDHTANNQSCNNQYQTPTTSESTWSTHDPLSFFDLKNIALLSHDV